MVSKSAAVASEIDILCAHRRDAGLTAAHDPMGLPRLDALVLTKAVRRVLEQQAVL